MFNNKMVLITGGTGSLGRALVKRLFTDYKPKKVIVLSRDEYKQHQMAEDFDYDNLRFFLGDVRDKSRLCDTFRGIDYVIHAAALKQIPVLEYNPEEAIKTNIIGSTNVVNACIKNNVKRAVLISTDKAVNPVNLYGATKLAAEKLFLAANSYNKTKFCCVRYGNVIGSRGSVVPFFERIKDAADSDGWGRVATFPITDVRMTRFWITLDDAVNLVFYALTTIPQDVVFVPTVPSMKIVDIARAIEPKCDLNIIGIRPGEKLHECLVSSDEDTVFLVDRDFRGCQRASSSYTSDTNDWWLTKEEWRKKSESIR